MNTLKKALWGAALLLSCQFLLGQDKYEANWESLSQYECPEWFQDAKFGIYAHWGVYSTALCPGTPDWYGHYMYVDGHPNNIFHLETYGSLDSFGYKDLVSQFTAPKFNADEWADFERVWLEKVKEVVDGYSPDLLWFDNRIQILSEDIRQEMMAYAYNHAAKNEQEFVLTFKRPDFPLGTGTVDLERSRMPQIYPEPWLTDNSVSNTSWTWSTDLKCYTSNRLIDDLVDIVSKNGCLLLNLAPHPDGYIPEDQKQRLREMGKWRKLNGEAIYESRPWLIYGEGPTETKTGHLVDMQFDGFCDEDIRFTTRDGQLYAIALGWPESGVLPINSLSSTLYNGKITSVELIGHEANLDWKQKDNALEIQLPESKPCEHAFVLKIKILEI